MVLSAGRAFSLVVRRDRGADGRGLTGFALGARLWRAFAVTFSRTGLWAHDSTCRWYLTFEVFLSFNLRVLDRPGSLYVGIWPVHSSDGESEHHVFVSSRSTSLEDPSSGVPSARKSLTCWIQAGSGPRQAQETSHSSSHTFFCFS